MNPVLNYLTDNNIVVNDATVRLASRLVRNTNSKPPSWAPETTKVLWGLNRADIQSQLAKFKTPRIRKAA